MNLYRIFTRHFREKKQGNISNTLLYSSFVSQQFIVKIQLQFTCCDMKFEV